jgi:hypothetical protein
MSDFLEDNLSEDIKRNLNNQNYRHDFNNSDFFNDLSKSIIFSPSAVVSKNWAVCKALPPK